MERDAGYIKDGGDYCILSVNSTALTDETLLSRIIDCVHIANTTSRSQHYDVLQEFLSEKLRIELNSTRDTLKVTIQQGYNKLFTLLLEDIGLIQCH